MFRLSNSKHPNLAKIYHESKNLINELPLVKRQRQKRAFFTALKVFFYSLAAVSALVLLFLGANLLTLRQVYYEASAGKEALEKAAELIRAKQYDAAMSESNQARLNFNTAKNNLMFLGSNFIVKRSAYASDQVNQAVSLVGVAEILSQTINQGAAFAAGLYESAELDRETAYARLSRESRRQIISKIYRSSPELTGIKSNLDLALLSLQQLKLNGVFIPVRYKIRTLENKLSEASTLLGDAIPLTRLLPALSGYPATSTFLVLLENSDELRPTGGFLGTYGILETDAGEIVRFETHDIYHLDMPVKDTVKVDPPPAIRQYLNNRWYMRDANWSPDWPAAAEEIERFYALENGLLPPKDQINNFSGKFTGVIAITPRFVTDLLSLVGAVEIEGVTYDENNFTELLEYRVEKGYVQLGVPSWQRKEVIGEIVKLLKIRLFDLPSSDWQEVSKIIKTNLQRKNILLNFAQSDLENLTMEQGWAGEIKKTAGDFLMVVDANLGALKTDAVMNRGLIYRLEERGGNLIARLTLNYANRGIADWKTSDYKTYTRVYVPAGSQLIRAEGYQRGTVEVRDELGKTSFGSYLEVPLGESRSLNLEYKLPDRIAATLSRDGYNLYLQKQPGNKYDEVRVDVNFKSGIKSYSPTGFRASPINNHEISWESDLTTDKVFEIKLQNN